jgi:hypothetical protein
VSTPISCDNEHCRLPSARVVNGALVIESRHHGEVHRCTISLHWLQSLLTTRDNSVVFSPATTVSAQKRVLPP